MYVVAKGVSHFMFGMIGMSLVLSCGIYKSVQCTLSDLLFCINSFLFSSLVLALALAFFRI